MESVTTGSVASASLASVATDASNAFMPTCRWNLMQFGLMCVYTMGYTAIWKFPFLVYSHTGEYHFQFRFQFQLTPRGQGKWQWPSFCHQSWILFIVGKLLYFNSGFNVIYFVASGSFNSTVSENGLLKDGQPVIIQWWLRGAFCEFKVGSVSYL